MDKEIEEYQDEVFIEDGENGERLLITIDEKTGNVFYLEPKNFGGKMTNERREKLKPIGVFNTDN